MFTVTLVSKPCIGTNTTDANKWFPFHGREDTSYKEELMLIDDISLLGKPRDIITWFPTKITQYLNGFLRLPRCFGKQIVSGSRSISNKHFRVAIFATPNTLIYFQCVRSCINCEFHLALHGRLFIYDDHKCVYYIYCSVLCGAIANMWCMSLDHLTIWSFDKMNNIIFG